MAAPEEQDTETYLLTGFSAVLDWKPVQFCKPLPRPMICDLCAVVSLRPVYTGSCAHWYCEPCYRRVLLDDTPICPLDRREVSKAGLEANTFPVNLRSLLREAGMRCPNYIHGCDYVLRDVEKTGLQRGYLVELPPLYALECHYSDCKFYGVSCEACGAPVVSSKIVEHMKSDCKGIRAPGRGKHQGEVNGGSC